MSGDIEDFLRRAAQRRQARQTNKPAPPPAPAERPQYSDARRERAQQAQDDDDELVVAEVVEEPLSRKIAELKRAQATAQATAQAMRQASGPTQRSATDQGGQPHRPPPRLSILSPSRSAPTISVTSQAPGPDLESIALGDVKEALRTPQGLRTAILLHEILARPEHRW